jgi:hypothetical protein
MSENNSLSGADDALVWLGQLLRPLGLTVRCALHLDSDADLAAREYGYRTVVLAGHAGSSFWPQFARFKNSHGGDDPLDAWSRSVGQAIAAEIGCAALYPFERPWWPFQNWIARAEGLRPSPLGILIHPEYGLWHGYRVAFAFRQAIAIPAPQNHRHACDSCVAKPCIRACPAAAITERGFRRSACREHLAGAAGKAGCMRQGCISRNACPVGAEYRYDADQLRFHMDALETGSG